MYFIYAWEDMATVLWCKYDIGQLYNYLYDINSNVEIKFLQLDIFHFLGGFPREGSASIPSKMSEIKLLS